MSVRELNPELAAVAQGELNEDPKRVKEDLQHLKDWLAKQPHLNARIDDQWLIAFLRGCKFSLERTKEKLDLYYAIRKTAPDLYRLHHKDPLFNEILELGSYLILPKAPGPKSPKICIISPGRYDADKYSISDVLSVSYVLIKILLFEDDHLVVTGLQTILDLEGVTMAHFFQMTPLQMKKMVVSGQDALPLRMKGTHYLNTPAGFETIFNAIKGLLNEKNKKRLYVHNKNYDEMYKSIPREVLPKEYGGDAGTIQEIVDYWKKKVEEYSDWLEEDLKYGTDESKRPGKPRTAESMFGVEGSFRQLEFD
ncbi:alpha-tocopherol transfer protein-like [Ostrinia nubilalis]|uniref:alpha-tocopherol transfer protein-like n=1 Tax=Ostrinia nubilalis TaxID=29057 RepID=UPI0030825E9D